MTLLATNWYKIFYWVTVADGVKGFFDTLSNWMMAFSIIFFIIYWIIFGISRDSSMHKDDVVSVNYWLKIVRRSFYYFFSICLITWTLYIFAPSKKDALIIIAGGAVGNFITSDSSAKQIPAEITLLLREKLKDEIKDLKTGIKDQIEDTLASKTKEELIEILKQKK